MASTTTTTESTATSVESTSTWSSSSTSESTASRSAPSSSSTTTSSPTYLLSTRWLRQESRQWEKLCWVDKELLVGFKTFSFHVIRQFHRNIILLDSPKNLVNFTNLLLILQVYGCIEVGNIFNRGLNHQILLACVSKITHWHHPLWGSLVKSTPSTTTPSE